MGLGAIGRPSSEECAWIDGWQCSASDRLENGRIVRKCCREGTSPAAIAATRRIEGGLKLLVVVWGFDLGDRISRRWVTGDRKCPECSSSGENPVNKILSLEAITAAPVVVEGPSQ